MDASTSTSNAKHIANYGFVCVFANSAKAEHLEMCYTRIFGNCER